MPAKPITHGIKVYAVCCSYTGYLHEFEIYTGKGSVDGSPKALVYRQELLGHQAKYCRQTIFTCVRMLWK